MIDIKKFISDTGVTFIASAMTMLLAFPITFLLGRFYGPSDLGLYRMVGTLFGVWILFADFGLSSAMIKYVAHSVEDDQKRKEYISSGILTALFLGIVSFSLMYFASEFFAGFFDMAGLGPLLKIMSVAFPFVVVNGVLLGILIGFREMKKHAWATIAKSVLMLTFTILLLSDYGVKGAIIAMVVSASLTTLLLVYLHRLGGLTFSNYRATSSEVLSFGSRTILANGINLINYQADVLMIGYFLLDHDVGIYSVAVMFAKLIWILPDSIQKITYPMFSEYHAKNELGLIELLLDRCMRYSFLFLLLFFTFMVVFGEDIITFIFGMEFKESTYPLIILLSGTVIYGVTKSIGCIFLAVEEVSIVYKIPLVSAIINVVLNLTLIPSYGINGAAVATSSSLIVSTFLMFYFIKKILDIGFDLKWYAKAGGFVALLLTVFVSSGLSIPFGILLLGCQLLFSFFILPMKDRLMIKKFVSDHFNF